MEATVLWLTASQYRPAPPVGVQQDKSSQRLVKLWTCAEFPGGKHLQYHCQKARERELAT